MPGYVIASLWAVSLLVCFVLGRKDRAASRARRRGGYVGRGIASGSTSHTMAPTRTHTATSTGCSTDGALQGEAGMQAMQAELSRIGARIASGAATDGSRGAAEPPTTAPKAVRFQEFETFDPWSRKVPPA